MESDDASNYSDEDLFYSKRCSIVRTSEGFSIRYILYWKTHFVFPNVDFFFD